MEDAPAALLASKPRPYDGNTHFASNLNDLGLAPGAPSAYEAEGYKSSQGDVYAASAQLSERARPPSQEESDRLRPLLAVQLMQGDYITDTMNALTALCANEDRVGPAQADASPLPPLQRPDPSSPLAMPSLLYRYANEEGLRVALWSMLTPRLCAFLLAILGRPVLLHVLPDAFAASDLALAFQNLEQPRLLIEIKTEAALSRNDMQALIENAAGGMRMVMPEFGTSLPRPPPDPMLIYACRRPRQHYQHRDLGRVPRRAPAWIGGRLGQIAQLDLVAGSSRAALSCRRSIG